MKKISKSILTLLITSITLMNISATEQKVQDTNPGNGAVCVAPTGPLEYDEQINKVFNDEGELVKFSVKLDLSGEEAKHSRAIGIVQFVTGSCFVIAVLSGYSCEDFARHLGLAFIDGLYLMGKNPYSGKWQVTYGYIEGCYPEHSGGCYGATYEKL